jgi:hypothetical protein
MSNPWIWLTVLLTIPTVGLAFNCPKLEKDLALLRKEFREFVSTPKKDGSAKTFEEVAAKLDKIVDIKNEMRKKGCKIPHRPKPWESK